MLTLTHHINEYLGAYWYTLEGTVQDSEGNTVSVGEGTAKITTIKKTIRFYQGAGFYDAQVRHNVVLEKR